MYQLTIEGREIICRTAQEVVTLIEHHELCIVYNDRPERRVNRPERGVIELDFDCLPPRFGEKR